jgi:hypothetical protein
VSRISADYEGFPTVFGSPDRCGGGIAGLAHAAFATKKQEPERLFVEKVCNRH